MCVELMLANQKAEAITEARLTVLMAIVVASLGSALRIRWTIRLRFPAELLDRAQPDAIGLSECTVDGTRLSNTHLGTMDERRYIETVRIAIAGETPRARTLVDSGLKNPPTRYWVAEVAHLMDPDPDTPSTLGQRKRPPCVTYQPLSKYSKSPSAKENPNFFVRSRNRSIAPTPNCPDFKRFANRIF